MQSWKNLIYIEFYDAGPTNTMTPQLTYQMGEYLQERGKDQQAKEL